MLSAHRRGRFSVSLLFILVGIVEGSWIARIPEIETAIHASNGAFGWALMGSAVGALIAMPVAGALLSRLSPQPIVSFAAACYLLAPPLIALSRTPVALLFVLAYMGAAGGAMNVSANVAGARVEREGGKPIMSSFHACFSLGTIVGTAAGGLAAGAHVSVLMQLCASAVLGYGILATAYPNLPSTVGPREEGESTGLRLPSAQAVGVGLLAFCILFGERAMADWTGIYLVRETGSTAQLAALGYASFSAAMVLGRLAGDRLVHRFGRERLVQTGTAIAAAGLFGSLIVHTGSAALFGFFCVGAGFSFVVPILFGAGANLPGVPPGVGLASVTTLGYLGFLTGPPVIGIVSDRLSLSWGLMLVAALSAMVAVGGPAILSGRRFGSARGQESPAESGNTLNALADAE